MFRVQRFKGCVFSFLVRCFLAKEGGDGVHRTLHGLAGGGHGHGGGGKGGRRGREELHRVGVLSGLLVSGGDDGVDVRLQHHAPDDDLVYDVVYLVGVENEIQLAHILERPVQGFHEH